MQLEVPNITWLAHGRFSAGSSSRATDSDEIKGEITFGEIDPLRIQLLFWQLFLCESYGQSDQQ